MANTMKPEAFKRAMIEKAASKGIELKSEDIDQFMNLMYETLQDSLLEYPSVSIHPLGLFSLSRLSPRIRVLRNTTYQTKTLYRVRYYINPDFHQKLLDAYEGFDLEDY